MSGVSITDLVKDWGGFEQLVAELHRAGDVEVERNAILTGRSGARRQIDVLIRHRQGLYEHLVIVECKYWNSAVERLHVDALATTVREVGASRGVIFSTRGFQSGAIAQAQHESIDLFTVREPTDQEWGAPGRHIDFYMHVISISLANFKTHDTFTFNFAQPSSTAIDLRLGEGDQESSTLIKTESGQDKSLEALIRRTARDAAVKAYSPVILRLGDNDECEALYRVEVNVVPSKPIEVFANGGIIFVPRMTFDIGIRISQIHFQHDRAKNYVFVLAVEDCIRRCVTAAARLDGETQTTLSPLSSTPDQPNSDVLQNGSIFQVWLKPLFTFDDFVDLVPGKALLLPRPEVQDTQFPNP